MAKACEQCGKGRLRGMQRSHSNIATIKFQKPNLQKRKINGGRVLICARCIKQK